MRLIKNFGIYTFSSLINAGIPFFLLPIITSYLSPEEFGIARFYQASVSIASGVILMGVPYCTNIFYFKHSRGEFNGLIKNALVGPVIFTLIFIITCILLLQTISSFFSVPYFWVLLIPFIAFGHLLPEIILTILRCQERPLSFAVLNFLKIGLHFGVTVVLIIYFGLTWRGIIMGLFSSYLILSIIAFVLLIKEGVWKSEFDIKSIRYAILLGSPLILQKIGGQIINKSDALFVSEMLGKDSLGLYAVGYQIGMVVLLAQDAFGLAWKPYVFKNLRDNAGPKVKKKLVILTYVVMSVYIIAPLVIWLLTPYIFEFFIDPRYHEHMMIAPLIALGYSFMGMYKLVTIYIFYQKKTGLISMTTLANAFLNLVLNYYFISRWGIYGAAYATILSMFIIFCVTFYFSSRTYPLPWNPIKLFSKQ